MLPEMPDTASKKQFELCEMLSRNRFVHFKAHKQNRWNSFKVLIQSERPDKPRTYKRAADKRVLTKVSEIPVINNDLRILCTE
jgi:hypothetical protein